VVSLLHLIAAGTITFAFGSAAFHDRLVDGSLLVFAIVRVATAAEAHYDQIVRQYERWPQLFAMMVGLSIGGLALSFYTMTILLKTSVTPHPATGTIDAPAFSIGIAGSAALYALSCSLLDPRWQKVA